VIDWTITDPLMLKLGEIIEPMKEDFLVVKLQPSCRLCNKITLSGSIWRDPKTQPHPIKNPCGVEYTLCDPCYNGEFCKTQKLQHPVGKDEVAPLIPAEVKIKEKCTDPDEVVESEVFDTRQAFLSLCQGNHYQFDELRRAKHTSMMTLYHIGNPQNGYVYVCNSCSNDIVSGARWHCNTCPDYDVCDTCFQKEKSHEHALERIQTSGTSEGAERQRKAREDRAKSISLHMQLLVHASACESGLGKCTSLNCEKMKELLRHGAQCKQRATGGCTICRRVWALLQIHARQCRLHDCKVPRCRDLREHLRKLALKQQSMDDRRRAAVTEQYRQLQSGTNSSENSGGKTGPTPGTTAGISEESNGL